MSNENVLRVQAQVLTDFSALIFQKLGVPEQDARIAAEVLVAADLRGVSSHGVAHLRRYADGLRTGVIKALPQEHVIVESPGTATLDADNGLGQPVSYRAMQLAIQKAKQVGTGFVAVRHSNHYGIAGYYAMMALEHNCIGFSLTNASPTVVPTFARKAMIGTNPIAVAAPAGQERPFVLDMATSTVALGKIEIADRLDKPIPDGWAVDDQGAPLSDAHQAMERFKTRAGVGLLPLGGAGELLSGFKGYGLSLWIDVMCGVLAGSAYADLNGPRAPDGRRLVANVGHLFGAWRIDAFRPLDEFKTAMDDLQRRIKNAPKEEGQERIYIAGEKEFEAAEQNLHEGVPLDLRLAADLQAIAQELQVKYNLE